MKDIKREDYILTKDSIKFSNETIMLENIKEAKVYDGSGDCNIKYTTNGKIKKTKFEFEDNDDEVFVNLLKEIKDATTTTRKRNIFEATKSWLYFLLGCAAILGVLYYLSVEGGSIRVPAIIIPVLEFIMDFGIIKTALIILGITSAGCAFSIIKRKTITEYTNK